MRSLRRSPLHRLPAAVGALLLLSTFASAQDATDQAGLPRFHQVSERLFRGGQPRAGGIRRLAELGIDTIVNLRGASACTRSDEAEARTLGLNYFNVPLPVWGRPDEARVRRVVEIIAAPESGRVFVNYKDGVIRFPSRLKASSSYARELTVFAPNSPAHGRSASLSSNRMASTTSEHISESSRSTFFSS